MNLAQVLTVSVLLLVALAPLLLENNYLIALKVRQNFGSYFGSGQNRGTYFNATLVLYQKNFIKLHRGTFFCPQTVNKNLTVFFYLKLLTCNSYNCVHAVFIYCFFPEVDKTTAPVASDPTKLIWTAKVEKIFRFTNKALQNFVQ